MSGPEAVSDVAFEELKQAFSETDSGAILRRLAEQLVAEKRFHELYEVRLMEARLDHNLPVILNQTIVDLPRSLQEIFEQRQLAACEEVGKHLLTHDRLGEAWFYLRVVGDRESMAEALQQAEPDEDSVEELIGIALQEGVAPKRGLEWVLEHYGTCNAVTMLDQELLQLSVEARRHCGELMVKHLHGELLENLQAEVSRQSGEEPSETSVEAIIEDRDWLFGENAYHIDTSHLAGTVRFARWVTDPVVLQQAVGLCGYGRRLASDYQYPGEEPFADLYPDHALFFGAQLGQQVDQALQTFEERASRAVLEEHGTLPAEVYIALLTRLDRWNEALEASLQLIPPGVQIVGLALPATELAKRAGACQRWQEVCRQRGDRVGYVAALVQEQQQKKGVPDTPSWAGS